MNRDILHKFHEGKASPREKESIKEWLEADPENEKEVLDEREVMDAVLLSATPCDPERATDKPRPSTLRLALETLKITAIAAAAFAGGIYFYSQKQNGTMPAIHTVSVPAGQRVKILLPDSTNVWLNARSEIRYPSAFTPGGRREVELDGEAYFEVSRRGGIPFVVHTGKCDVEVRGTTFNLEAYGNSDTYAVALIEGSVTVTDKANPLDAVTLAPNRKAEYAGGRLSVSPVNAEDYDAYRWREGLLCFRDISFTELLGRLEKCYDVRIITENNNLAGYIINGKLRISDGIDNAMRVLQKEARYTFVRDSETNVIYIY
jgi:ferric-dicitrate binding protein FerR (iron transport regulator)